MEAQKYNLPTGYLSASAITTYLGCGKKYFYRYIEKEGKQKSEDLAIGGAIHKAFETFYKEKIKTGGQPYSPRQSSDMAVAFFEERAKKDNLVLENKDKLVFNIKNTTEPYIAGVTPAVKPTEIEKEVTYLSACGVALKGYIDLVHNEGKPVIADYKVTSSKMNVDKLSSSLQFGLYSLMTGVVDIQIHNLVKAKKKYVVNAIYQSDNWSEDMQEIASNVRLLRHKFSKANNIHMERIIEDVAGGISSGTFMRCDPGNFLCNEKWCEYYTKCRK